MSWQPIETAPKDRPVLILDEWGDMHVGEHYKGEVWSVNADYFPRPTHWHPLPVLPDSQ